MSENVVICCAEEDEPILAPVVSALLERGCTPELLAGIDLDPMELGRFMDGHDNGTLYVLCESDRFRRRTILQAEGMFGARRGPGDELLRVLLDEGPEVVAERILNSSGAGATHTPAKPEGGREGGIQREVLGAGSSGGGGSPTGWSRQSAAHRAAAISRAQHGAGKASPPRAAAPQAAAERAAAPRSSEVPTRRATPPASNDGVEIDMESRGAQPLDSQAPASVPPSPAPLPEKRGWGGVAALMVVLFAAAAAAFFVGQNREAEKESSSAPRGAPGVVASADEGQPEPVDDVGSANEGEGVEDEGVEDEVAEQPPIYFRNGEDSDKLREAIDTGELRVLDLLYVATAPRRDFNYAAAEEHCASLELGGVTGFRLPGPKEIKRIRKSRMLERGRFWTNKPAGEGFAFVLNTQSTPAIAPGRKKFGGVRAVCVKER